MTNVLGSAYYVFGFTTTLWLVLTWMGSRFAGGRRARNVGLGFGAGAAVLAFVPLAGLPLWRWSLSLWPNPSLPLVGLTCCTLAQRWSGRAIFSPADRRAAWIFGAVAGTALYLPCFLPIGIDLYYWGWHGVVPAAVLAALAVVFLAAGNRLDVLLLAGLVAWSSGALESTNGWDYVIDPFYWVSGLSVGAKRCLRWFLNRRRNSASPTSASPTG